jgi:uncharacterized protein YyaL (SSP411 family)
MLTQPSMDFKTGSHSNTSTPNELNLEKSPYLQQHATNPVHWKAWNENSFQQARREGKIIFLSIGYSTCHWCHVMEKESFEDEAIAKYLNEHFVSIKVDREELPQVDAIYMEALQLMTKRGGWPLNIFLDHELRPFFGGTYFNPKAFLQVLNQIQNLWATKRDEIFDVSTQMHKHLSTNDELVSIKEIKKINTHFKAHFIQQIDMKWGGHKGAPKFPMNTEAQVILRLFNVDSDLELKNPIETTFNKILLGGIWDHLAGGIHRYSTDEEWRAPHFEKMLYDQASLLAALAELLKTQSSYKDFYKLRAEQLIKYLKKDLMNAEGAFYSSEDADSEGVEGTFYVWTYEELKKTLSPDELIFLENNFEVNFDGNWEGKCILHASHFFEEKEFEPIRESLLQVRAQRQRPLRDEKVISAWNALMITALTKYARASSNQEALEMAESAVKFIKTQLFENGVYYRRWINGERKHLAQHEDYAFLIEALLELYSTTAKIEYLNWAEELQENVETLFWNATEKSYFCMRNDDANLIVRNKREFYDNVVPSELSATLHNLIWLGEFTTKQKYLEKAKTLAEQIPSRMEQIPGAFPRLLEFLNLANSERETLVILSDETQKQLPLLNKIESNSKFKGRAIVSKPNEAPLFIGKALTYKPFTYYLCKGKTCMPASREY